MIRKYKRQNKQFDFVDNFTLDSNHNVFTVIVGKNGTGKSTLLSSIVRELLGEKSKGLYGDSELGFDNYTKGRFEIDNSPEMVIAVSTSPFDKFPLNRRMTEIAGYSYLGLRDLMSANFGLAYMSKIISSLIESVINRPDQFYDLQKALNYLGYKENIHAQFTLNSSRRIITELVEHKNPFEYIAENRQGPFRSFNKRFFLRDELIDEEKVRRLLNIAHRIIERNIGLECNLKIGRNGIELDHGYEYFGKEIIFLIQSGFLRLRNIGLESLKANSIFSIKDASSGEQSVILSILGIASKIKNNSIICIDEPEVCLHPEWQEKYIQILVSTFAVYQHCHFIIATHSPQIITRLPSSNCYIMNMETGQSRNSREYINNSVDFQLANIFDSPGYKNEYLSRIALNIFTKVNKKKLFDEDDVLKYNLLKQQSQFMDKNDPVKNLYLALEELHKLYA